MTDKTVLKKSKNIVSRKIADETVLLPIYKSSEEINCIYTLNKAAAFLWDHIDGKNTLGKIKQLVIRNFDVAQEEADRRILAVIKEFQDIKAI